MWKSTQETVKGGVIELRSHETGAVAGKTNLLLMVPAFRQFACSVKPVERRLFTGPAHIECGWSEGVERLVEIRTLLAGRARHLDQDRWTETTIDGDTFSVEAIHQGDQVLRRGYIRGFDEMVVANEGEFAKCCIEEVRCHVADLPLWGDGLEIPFMRGERTQQRN
jgi:hypothetical protein